MSRRCGLLLATFLSLGVPSAVHSGSGQFLINAPVPAELKDLVAAMLKRERPHDAEAALAGTKVLDRSWQPGQQLILRIEADCRDDLCMTVIARVTQGAIVPELVLNAGPTFHMSDSGQSLWASEHPVWAMVFAGTGGSHLVAMIRNGQWVVEANGPFRPPATSMIETPRQSSPPVPLEEFRAQLGLEP